MNLKRKIRFLTFLTFFDSAFFAASGVSAQTDDTIHYQIKPVPAADRTNLEIAVRFKAETGSSVKISLSQDCFDAPLILPHSYLYSTENFSS